MCRQNKPNMVHLFKYEFVQVPCMSSIGMGQSDRVKRIGRAGQPRQLSGLAVRTFLLTPLVLRHGCLAELQPHLVGFGTRHAAASEMRMDECRLHAHFDVQAATSSGATWGSAKPTTVLEYT